MALPPWRLRSDSQPEHQEPASPTAEKKRKTENKNKSKKKMNRQNPRTNGKSKPKQTKSHKEAYTYILTKGEKRKKYIYI